jgi:hypothetical protein
MPRKKSPQAQEQQSITDYAKVIENAVLECSTNGQGDSWRQQNYQLGWFGLFTNDDLQRILDRYKGNKGLQRAVLAGLISACVQLLLADV